MATAPQLSPQLQSIMTAARARSEQLSTAKSLLDARHYVQRAHLTCPATQWKYIETAVTKSHADLVMIDLEDSIPRGNEEALTLGRANVIRAFQSLDWGDRLRYFRPRGTLLDPAHEDLVAIVPHIAATLDGVTLPKIDSPEELQSFEQTLSALEALAAVPEGSIRVQVLIESVRAEEAAFAIAACSKRLTALIFGAFDYWSTLGVSTVSYRVDHPLVQRARERIVKAAASVGVVAIAEMTLEFPTKDKSEPQRAAAIEQCRQDALLAKSVGMQGKWTGIPAQTDVVLSVFSQDQSSIARAIAHVRAFAAAERAGRGAVMIDGEMADRATDRVHRMVLTQALAQRALDPAIAAELGINRSR
jgi:citrate lyase subunit beta/citryl-CoA lyase